MKLSVYDQHCLPTWDEMYNEFWKQQIFRYDPSFSDWVSGKDGELLLKMDPYWNRHRDKMILAWACNQLNKMVFEDGVDVVKFVNEELSASLTEYYGKFTICDEVRFGLLYMGELSELPPGTTEALLKMESQEQAFETELGLRTKKLPPRIYACKIPSTGQYSIFKTQHPSIDVDDLEGTVKLCITILRKECIEALLLFDIQRTIFSKIIRFVIKDIIEYFENGIGWKDKDGKVIPTEQVTHCQGAGYDPAL